MRHQREGKDMYSPENEYKKLISKLRKACEEKGYTYYTLAREAHIATSTMYNIMNGKTMPNVFTLLMLYNALGFSVEDICFEKGTSLEKDEYEILKRYHGLSDKKKEWLNATLKMLEQ